jgi:hypothetical protein
MKCAVEGALDELRRHRDQIQQGTSPARDGKDAEARLLRHVQPARSPDGDTVQLGRVSFGNEDLSDGALELPELPEIGRTAVRGDPTCRQTSSQDVAFEAWF